MKLTDKQLEQLETPCIVIDVEQALKNIANMQAKINSAGCTLRPHIKTHKMSLFAKMQMQAGAVGITCAKVSEAEVMADGGLKNIFIAYPMVGNFRIRRAIALAKKINRLILAVDSIESATALNDEAIAAGVILEVRLEIDTGAGRTGVLIQNAADLAKSISLMDGLKLTGIYTFKGLIFEGKPTQDKSLAAQEEGELMAKVAQNISKIGLSIKDISAGSSPTGVPVACTGLVTEVRPGTYIFNDLLLCSEKVSLYEQIAVRYFATVVNTQHSDFAVIDGGSKAFASDIPLNVPPFNYEGYAIVEGRPDLSFSRMNEEHGILTSTQGNTKLHVGDKISLIPIHVCTAINHQNKVYLLEKGNLTQHLVEARGMTV